MQKIRMGLIGCGNMMKSHARAVDACTEELSITAVCDIRRERAEEVATALRRWSSSSVWASRRAPITS